MALAAQAIVLRRVGAAGARVLAPVVVGSGANQPQLPHKLPPHKLPQRRLPAHLPRLHRLRRLRHLSLRQRRRRLSVAMALAAQAIVLRRGGAAGARVLAPVVVGSGANQPRLPHRLPQLRLPQIPLLRRRRRGRAQLWSALLARASARISALTMADSGPTSAGALQCTSTAHAQMVRRECLLVVSARMRSAPPGGAAWRIG